MKAALVQKHGSMRNLVLNLVLLGIAGVVLLRLAAAAVYLVLPTEYFLRIDSLEVTNVDACEPQHIEATAIREIYQYLPESIAKHRTLNVNSRIELFRADGRKVDDLERTPVVEWKEQNIHHVEFDFSTTLVPGRYYIEITNTVILPIIGAREETVRVRSNTFVMGLCKPLPAPNPTGIANT